MPVTCSQCGRSVGGDDAEPQTNCPHCGHAIPTSAAPAPPDDLRTRIDTLWAGAIPSDTEPGMTLKHRTIQPGASADSPLLTIRHEDPKRRSGESVSSRLQVRAQDVAGSDERPEPPPHYQLLKVLGEGGMGVVYQARQTSIDRTIALKMIKPDAAQEPDHRNKFLAEAVVTGELDHPNIVPIHDLAAASDGALFYAMKEVRGTPWSHALGEKTLDENLDILMRVADAVAFAHSKGIVHRDLKPDNVMLGDFGEVLLMDWGLAVAVTDTAKGDRLSPETAAGGTPCYMAPEMARGDADQIGPQSDVYLLGAILYQLITGHQPHHADGAMECVFRAAENRIEPTEQTGELIDIAMTAMATEPGNRHADVKAFQAAVREYQRHQESTALARHAESDLARARQMADYTLFSEAVSACRHALRLWEGNGMALRCERAARLAYAQCALDRRDLDLAASLLSEGDPDHAALLHAITNARTERDSRRKRLRAFKLTAAALAVTTILIFGVALVWIQAARRAEQRQRLLAETALADLTTEQTAREADRAAAAPAMVQSAKLFVEQQDFDSAKAMAKAALDYDDTQASAHKVQVLLLMREQDFKNALVTCERLLGKSPDDTLAQRLRQLCLDRIRGDAPDASLAELGRIAGEMGMPTVGAEFLASVEERLTLYRQKLDDAWPGFGARLLLNLQGQLTLSLAQLREVASVEPLAGIPLNVLNLQGTSVRDLRPLKGMPLTSLNLTSAPVDDLSPLKGAPLESLLASGTAIRSLEPLRGAPLQVLNLGSTRVNDLAPLTGMPLEDLSVNATSVQDLSPLAGMPMERLNIGNCPGITNLAPLAGMPLTYLHASGTQIRDLSPLRDSPLLYLSVSGLRAVDLSPLQGKALTYLSLGSSPVSDITQLAGMPIEELALNATLVSDLTPLRGMPLKRLYLGGSAHVSDLGPLRGMPLQYLDAGGTAVRDLAPLKGLPLRILLVFSTPVTDLSPLKGMHLTTLGFSSGRIEEGIDVIRGMKTLDGFTARRGQQPIPAEEFWEQYDRGAFTPNEPVDRLAEHRAKLEQAWPDLEFRLWSFANQGIALSLRGSEDLKDLSPLSGMPLTSLDILGTAVTNLSPLRGIDLTILDISHTAMSDLSPLARMPLTMLTARGTRIANLSTLQGMPLKTLTLDATPVRDLTPLSGLPLEVLALGGCNVSDLDPLRGTQLTSLNLRDTAVSDIRPLAGMPLDSLVLAGTRVLDVAPLHGMPLQSLDLSRTQVRDLTPLKGMPLSDLKIASTDVRDLAPLAGMQLRSLHMTRTRVEDLTPLAGMPLRTLTLDPAKIRECLQIARDMATLREIGLSHQSLMPAAEFWRRYDAGELE